MEGNTSRLSIQIDLAKSRIRIHKVTLAALGGPEYILLLVNPEEKTLGILVGNMNMPGVHRMRTTKGGHCYELYSTSLARQLRKVMPEWINGGKYLLNGELLPNGTVLFPMSDAVHTATSTPKYHD